MNPIIKHIRRRLAESDDLKVERALVATGLAVPNEVGEGYWWALGRWVGAEEADAFEPSFTSADEW